MNVTAQIALTAGGIIVAAAGVLFPLRSSITESSTQLEALESERLQDASVSVQLEDVKRRIHELIERQAGRTQSLCPDTPEARHEFESSLLGLIREGGLRRISMDSRSGVLISGAPAFVISLVVEGDPGQVHRLLLGLEGLGWLSRVLEIDVKSGAERRRTSMEIAVLLEETES